MGGDYTLKVCHEGTTLPVETVRVVGSETALKTIPALLNKHPGCHRIHVFAGHVDLFSVDCDGKTVVD